MLAIGLTGGVCCGKTAVLKFLRGWGAETLDCDRIVRGLMKQGTDEYRRIVKHFGEGVLDRRGRLDRKKLRAIVLDGKGELEFLERLLHPAVKKAVKARIGKLRKRKGLLAVEVPLLFESGMDRMMDATAAVTAPRRLQIRNARKKGLEERDFARFEKRQWTQRKKAAAADRVIRNDGTLAGLRARARKVFLSWLKGKVTY